MDEDESHQNSQTEEGADETRSSERIHKLLRCDHRQGVILAMTRRKTVKNRQLGVCGDMHVFHIQCTTKIHRRRRRRKRTDVRCMSTTNKLL
jgi:hypothetical protein